MEKNYLISGDFSALPSLIREEKEYIFLIDRNVENLYGITFQGGKIVLDVRESLKNIETINSIIERMLELGVTRDALLIGVGGGITTDIAGFVASIYKRGVRVAFVPTTLTGQIDAAIGGKNGVNSVSYKNMIGCFKEPEWIYVNRGCLDTLPREHYLSGVVELLKTFIIADREAYFKTVDIIKKGAPIEENLLQRAIDIKSGIVERDRFERGERMVLNLGHTFGHAIEMLGEIPHGFAVAQGIVIAARISNYFGLLPEDEMNTVMRDFSELGLIKEKRLSYSKSDLFQSIIRDKKRSEDFIRFVAIERVGLTRIVKININELENVAGDLY